MPMKPPIPHRSCRLRFLLAAAALEAASLVAAGCSGSLDAATVQRSEPGSPGAAYANMPAIAPIGARIGKYMDVPETAKGPPIDPAKGYRIQDLGKGLYMVTEGVY